METTQMAEDKHADKHADEKKAEDLTPTPTQAEMDKIMSGLSDEDLAKAKKPAAREGVEAQHMTPTSHPPTMTQAENDDAMADATPGDFPDGTPKKKREKDEAEAKHKKELEADDKPAGYQTRTVAPAKK
jgi:hypothetical protein